MYEALNDDALARVPASARRVLDLGCGTGRMGERLDARGSCRVVGVTRDLGEAREARTRLAGVVLADLEADLPLVPLRARAAPFDAVVLSHVLEHLREPERILRAVRDLVPEDGAVIVALPNVLHWRVRGQFARGHFRYSEGGTLDRTHYRFFDVESARRLLPSCGYRLRSFEGCGHLPGSRWLGRGLGRRLDRLAMRLWPGLLAWQFVMVGTPETGTSRGQSSGRGVSFRR